MKRVLSLGLALLLAVTLMPMSVFAVLPTNILGMSEGAEILDDRIAHDFGVIVLGTDKSTIDIPIIWQAFNAKDPSIPLKAEDITSDITTRMYLEFENASDARLFGGTTDGKSYPGVSFEPWKKDRDATIVLSAKNVGKANGRIRVMYNHQDLTAPVPSAWIALKGDIIDPTINKKIDYIHDKQLGDGFDPAGKAGIYVNGTPVKKNDLDAHLSSIRPGTEVVFLLDSDFFEWTPKIDYMWTQVRKSTLDNNFVSVRRKIAAGSDIVQDVQIENIDGHGHVVVRFEEFYNKTAPRDFDMTITLTHRGVGHEPTTLRLIGTLENEEYDVMDNYDYIFTGDGLVVNALASCRGVELEMGAGAILTTNLISGKKYYARASEEATKDDSAIMEAYPVIRKAITIYSHNIKALGNNSVRFNQDELERVYFVYDESGVLLGNSNENLPFRNKYYLALEEIVVDLELDDMDFEEYEEGDNPPTGGSPAVRIISIVMLGLSGVSVAIGAGLVLNSRKKEEELQGGL